MLQPIDIDNNKQKKKLKSIIKATAKVTILLLDKMPHYIINNTSEKQTLRLTLDLTILEKRYEKPKGNTSL